MTCYDNPSFALFDHLLVVLQDGVDVSQLRVVWQKVNLMKVVFDFFPVGSELSPEHLVDILGKKTFWSGLIGLHTCCQVSGSG